MEKRRLFSLRAVLRGWLGQPAGRGCGAAGLWVLRGVVGGGV